MEQMEGIKKERGKEREKVGKKKGNQKKNECYPLTYP
jgi:hypothetical protein